MSEDRTKTWLGVLVMGVGGGICWALRHEAANVARGIPAHDSVIMKLGTYMFWGLGLVMLLGATGVISQRSMNNVANFLPTRRRRVVIHHHHHFHANQPPPEAHQNDPPSAPKDPNAQPAVTKWTD